MEAAEKEKLLKSINYVLNPYLLSNEIDYKEKNFSITVFNKITNADLKIIEKILADVAYSYFIEISQTLSLNIIFNITFY